MNNENTPDTGDSQGIPNNPQQVFAEDAFWSVLHLPLPEIERVVAAMAAVTPDEYLEASWGPGCEALPVFNSSCARMIAASGVFATRLESARVGKPLAVLIACMRARPLHGLPEQERILWDQTIGGLESAMRALVALVRYHASIRSTRDADLQT